MLGKQKKKYFQISVVYKFDTEKQERNLDSFSFNDRYAVHIPTVRYIL